MYDRLRLFLLWRGMKAAVKRFCRKCLVCVTRRGCKPIFRSHLQHVSAGGPFHHLAVDVLQLPFMDISWVEVFPMADQKTETIAKLFIENVVC